MKIIGYAVVISAVAVSALAQEVNPETVAKIEAYLTSVDCQMDPSDIEIEEDGYELDDVICIGGDQFDIVLDKDLNEVERRAE